MENEALQPWVTGIIALTESVGIWILKCISWVTRYCPSGPGIVKPRYVADSCPKIWDLDTWNALTCGYPGSCKNNAVLVTTAFKIRARGWSVRYGSNQWPFPAAMAVTFSGSGRYRIAHGSHPIAASHMYTLRPSAGRQQRRGGGRCLSCCQPGWLGCWGCTRCTCSPLGEK
jgi:hypothetical protein